jgi:hypothetical protein
VVGLLGDPQERVRLACEGRARAERDFDWRSLGKRLEHVLAEAAG